jgi:PAS domain S-box-containing protein
MAKKPDRSTKVTGLRLQAEELLRATKRDVAAMPVKDLQELVHELQVHQIKLEMQSDELRRTQMELEVARDRYVELYDFSPAGHFTLDMQNKIVEANQRAETLLGENRIDLIGQPLARFIAAEDKGTFYRHCQEVLRSGMRQTCEVRLRKDAGVSHWVHFESLAVHDELGHITHWRTALLDISDRKRAEDEVRHSETFISSILENLPDMIFVKEAKYLRFVRLNKAGEDLLGYLRSELMGKNDYDFFPHDEADFFTAKDREVLACGRLLDIPQEPIQTRSGEVRYLHTKKIPIVGKEGTPQYLLGISEDITDRRRVEQALRLAKFSMDRAADAVYWIDPQAKVFDVNEAASLMLGYSKEELCAMTVHDLNPDFQADMWPGFWAETKRRGTIVLETAHRAKNGRLIPIEVSVNYLSHEGKEYHCAFVRDITERKRAEGDLRESEARLRAILDNSPGMVFLKDTEGRYLHVNRQFERTLHLTSDQVRGKTDEAIFDHEQAAVFRANDLKVLQTGVSLECEEVVIMQEDGPHTSIVSKFPLYGGDGKPYALCGITTDITYRKRVEEALRLSEERYRSIFENAVEGMFQTTPDGKYAAVNPALARMYGYDSPEDLIAGISNIATEVYVDPGRRDEFVRLMQEQEEISGFEALVYRKDGRFIWISESVRAVRDSSGVLVGYEGTVEHITERKLAEERLRATLDQVRSLSGRLATVQEEERTRIARELHDELGVGLTCLKIDLSRLTAIVGNGISADARANLDDKVRSMVEQIDMTIASVQRLVTELRPAVLDDLGLVAAIEWQCQDFQKRTGISCTCVTSADDIPMDPERATALFRICQEALTNTVRYAQATAVTIKLESRNDFLQLVVADNGVGIPDTKVSDRRSLGLLGMKERVALFGGELTIQGIPEKGTTITVYLPLRQP